jgi:hypothetical protein
MPSPVGARANLVSEGCHWLVVGVLRSVGALA